MPARSLTVVAGPAPRFTALDLRPPATGATNAARWWTTPRRLRAAFAAVCVLSLLLGLACVGAAAGARAGLRGVGQDAAPSIVAAGRLRVALAALDANLVNVLLCPPGSTEARAAENAIATRRAEIAEQLVSTAEKITFGEGERTPLATVVENLPPYEALLDRARTLRDAGELPGALAAERVAASGMRDILQPALALLAWTNEKGLAAADANARTAGQSGAAAVLAAGSLLVGMLGVIQWWLFRRTRRVFNPALLAATVLAVGWTVWTVVSLFHVGDSLRASTDAFARVHRLRQTRAAAYTAHAEESRWLFDGDPVRRTASERAFLDGAARVAGPGTQRRIEFSPAAFQSELYGALIRAGLSVPLIPGYLAEADGGGHGTEGTTALARFGEYLTADTQVRDLEASGNHSTAVAWALSYAPTGANGAFRRFDDALGEALTVHEQAFARALADGARALTVPVRGALPVALAVVTLTFLGLRPRWREYAA